MHMETFQVFCDLVETTSFSEAAVRNGISQSAVSQQIRALEERFQVTLLERGRRNFSVTPEGEVFLKAAQNILQAYYSIEQDLGTMRDVVAGPLTISTVYSIGFHELPPYLETFREQFPEVDLQVHYRRSNQVYADVSENLADLGLVAYPQERKGVEIEPAWKDKLVVICPPNHPLAKRQSLDLKAIDGQRFISFEPDLPTRKAIDGMFTQAGISVKEVVEFDNIETVKRGVLIENAISIVPSESVRSEVKSGSLAQIAINGKFVWRPLGIVRRRTKAITPAMREMIRILKQKETEG
ncbi:MAG: LysR family transcriptional regulator [Verrucomicrobiales bacterium]|jgi:DNA-binding transcriptional LysR family regulator|nr:LysR family transcriptional regulator [Verrucomicrobiales bacterium]MDP4793611.1 LysR family transcriptional regulator [Verrucomicrobiales bacterium]MDP4849025.1 LysR family transcriptional regulator [Verrucomicrobiales bacterium]MDP5004653.1 LysR family transcriptional regulator [Verrucomicrobiales bacterium]